MDIELKQRLVGAVVIVALGVVFIPMLLDGPGEPGDEEVEVAIPAPPTPRYETRRLPLDPDEEPATETRPAPVVREPVEELVVTRDDDEPWEEPRRGGSTPTPEAAAPPTDDRSVDPEGDARAPEPVAPAAGAAGRALPGQWTLQLGSFSRADNAASLVARAEAVGLAAWAEPVAVGDETVHRVRAGAWDERDAALAAAHPIRELLALGGSLSVRRVAAGDGEAAPAAGAVAGAASTPRGTDGEGTAEGAPRPEAAYGWWVQAGVFAREANAVQLQDRLRQAGLVARAEPIELGGEPHYRVRVGPQLDEAEAEAVLARLAAEFGITGLLVPDP